ncbi:MAG: TRAP transporter fused permease subunit [Deltaproteobacteria bacterium]|nr:MAG: TRAP transporter fused permease subunit [Deltaproteobacteria bacterium]
MKFEKVVDGAIVLVGIPMAIYHLTYTQYMVAGPIPHQNIHLGLALILVFLTALRKSRKHWRLPLIAFILLSLIATGYVHIFYEDLEIRAMFNTIPDLIIGALLILLALEATRRSFGLLLPLLAAVAIVYAFLGHHIPEPFRAQHMSIGKTISSLSIGLTGIYGTILRVSANFIFLYVLFGTLMVTLKATGFFMQVGRLIGRVVRSGPAMAAVVTSSLVGSVTGQAAANVAITGSFTIPLMKRVGYKPEQAGGIEAAASTGGQIMPPVMGAAAFLMSGITGYPYREIIVVAAIPAILYFLVVGIYVQLQAVRLNVSQMAEEVDLKEMLLSAPLFLIPLALMVFLLVKGFSAMYVAFWAIVIVTVLSLIRKKTRPSFRELVNGFVQGAVGGARIGVSCACVGVIVSVVVMTGLGVKLPSAIEAWSGGNLNIVLALTMVASIILGCGVPTSAAYVLVAVVMAPVMLKLGLEVLQAHFFCFFFACFSFITPPVAVASLFACELAGAPYLKTAFESAKAGIAGFVLPFMIIWCPVLFLRPSDPLSATVQIAACIMILVALQVTFCNHYLARLSLTERALLVACFTMLLAYLVTQNYAWSIAGFILFIGVTVWQLRKTKLPKPALEALDDEQGT